MLTFDYITAWHEVAKPAYEALPANVRVIVERVAAECANLNQIADLSMPWPDENSDEAIAAFDGHTLRQTFDKIPAEVLALASRVVYIAGHWQPAGVPRLVPGASWKFSHYADQVLRGRLGMPEAGDNGRDKATIQYKVIEGVIRVCYNSPNMWTWEEVAPATAGGQESAQRIAAELRAAIETAGLYGKARDNAAYTYMEKLKARRPLSSWPSWEKFDTDQFMVTEYEMKRRQVARLPMIDRAALIAKMRADANADIKAYKTKRIIEVTGKVWLINQGLPIDNAIYYSHTGRWCFGWRQPLTLEERSALLDVLSEFPYDYDLKGGEK